MESSIDKISFKDLILKYLISEIEKEKKRNDLHFSKIRGNMTMSKCR